MLIAEASLDMRLRFGTLPWPMRRAATSGVSVAFLLLAVLGAGCSVTASLDGVDFGADSVRNSCDQSCAVGLCVDGICEARASDLKTVLAEVTFPSGTARVAGLNFTTPFTITDGAADIVLEDAVRFSGTITGAKVSAANCIKIPTDSNPTIDPDGSIPSRITLLPRTRLLGIAAAPLSAETPTDNIPYEFAISAPPGGYDIFVEPLGSDSGCFRPPYLVVNQQLRPGDVTLKQTLPEPQTVNVSVEFPAAGADLSEFELAMVEGATGRVISNVVKLGKGTTKGDLDVYSTRLAYSTVQGALEVQVPELLRLSPPEGVTAPTVFVERAVAEIFQLNEAVLHQLQSIPKPITISGGLTGGSSKGLRSKVTFVATSLDCVAPGTPFLFTREAEAKDDGSYSVELLPGDYRVIIEPENADYGLTELSYSFPSSGDFYDLLLFGSTFLSGAVSTPHGGIFPFLDYELLPVPKTQATDFMGTPLPARRHGSGATNSDGLFAIPVDTGAYTMTFRPSEALGYPWVVIPTVTVTSSGSPQLYATASLPISLKGEIRSPDVKPAASAFVRFYALMNGDSVTDDWTLATRAIPIAEARADETGSYSVLLPSRIGSETQ